MKRCKLLVLMTLMALTLVGCDGMTPSIQEATTSEPEEIVYPGEGFYIGEDYDTENFSFSNDDCITISAEEWEGMVLYQIEFGMSTNRYASYINEIDGSPTEIISFSFDPNSSEGIASVSEATVAVSLDGDVATVVHTDAYGSGTTIYTRMQG